MPVLTSNTLAEIGANPTEPWQRCSGEGRKPFAAFNMFLELGDSRTLINAARLWRYRDLPREEALAKDVTRGPTANVERFSRLWCWLARAEAWDQHLVDTRRREILDQQKVMVRRHADVAVMMQSLAIGKLSQTEPEDLTLQDATRMIKDSVAIEREARGVPTQIVHSHRADDGIEGVSALTDAALTSAVEALFGDDDDSSAD